MTTRSVAKLEQLGIEKGLQLGEQRGIEKGEREAPLKIARTMLQNGIDRNTVMKMTALSGEHEKSWGRVNYAAADTFPSL